MTLNSRLDHRIVLTAADGADAAGFCFTCHDYSSEVLLERAFMLSFGTTDLARNFAETLARVQGDDVSAALGALTV